MNTIRMFFLDQEGRVRWGYKFLTLVLILELLLPVLLLFVSGFGLAVSLPALRERGIVDAHKTVYPGTIKGFASGG